MSDPKEIFKKYCINNGMRFTPERGVIIDVLYRINGHFDVDKLYLKIREIFPQKKLAKGSIYRSIPHFLSSGLIRESLSDDNRKYYEPALGCDHHDHLKCLGCGKIFEFSEKQIDEAQKRLLKRLNFEMISHVHVINGYCRKCREKNECGTLRQT